jgi:predicted Zn-dependent peptidase
LIVAGDLTAVEPFRLAADRFGDWLRDGEIPASGDVPTISQTPQVVVVDFPEAPQATLRVGGRGVTRADERWAPMFVANHAVGGSFSSRVNTVLREQKGVTYGANSSLETGRGAGALVVSTAVRSDAAAESVSDILAILGASAGALTDQEVADGVRAAADSAPLGFERAEAVANRVEMLLSQALPLDHVDRNLARIRAVTTQEANDVYAAIVRPEELTIVVVGDAGALQPSLAALEYADVCLLASDGSPLA